jgi:hypothetical protein
MKLRIGTVSLNNLFSRWNFKGELAKNRIGRGWHLERADVLAAHQPDPQARWTMTHKQTGEDRQFAQYDYLLVPPSMAKKVEKAWVERRKTTPAEPEGSDHDPVAA